MHQSYLMFTVWNVAWDVCVFNGNVEAVCWTYSSYSVLCVNVLYLGKVYPLYVLCVYELVLTVYYISSVCEKMCVQSMDHTDLSPSTEVLVPRPLDCHSYKRRQLQTQPHSPPVMELLLCCCVAISRGWCESERTLCHVFPMEHCPFWF